ncbi:ROK family protein [Candidatus Parcubacteria bacterium]|nr:ROK family protein [Candidatus Parcubacteria bacterium]
MIRMTESFELILGNEVMARSGYHPVWFGHASMFAAGDTRTCECGSVNCIETFLSKKGLAITYCDAQQKNWKAMSASETDKLTESILPAITVGLVEGDAEKRRFWDSVLSRYMLHLKYSLRNVGCAYLPSEIIIKGEIISSLPQLKEKIRAFFEQIPQQGRHDHYLHWLAGIVCTIE